MSQYKTGSVTVTAASATVTGSETVWLTYVSVGDTFKIEGENAIYNIASVDSDTQITLTSAYAGATASGQSYQITVDFTPNLSIPEIWSGDLDWPYHLTQGLRLIDTLFAGTANTLKQVCRVATTADLSATYNSTALTLTADANGAISVDGVSLAANDRLLVKDQTDKKENGIYYVTTVGTAGTPFVITRATDFDASADIKSGTLILVSQGTMNFGSGWGLITPDTITLDTTSLEFMLLFKAGETSIPLNANQGIHLTAEAAAAIYNVHSAVYSNTTNSFSIGGIFALPDWTPSANQVLRNKWATNVGYKLEVVATSGAFILYLNGKTYTSAVPGGGTTSNLIAGSKHSILAVPTVGTTTTVAFYLDGVLLSITAAQANEDVTNTENMYTGGTSAARYAMDIFYTYDFNRALSTFEVWDLHYNGVNYVDKYGSQTEQTSGTLTVGKKYRINNWITDDDFTNIGGTNVDGTEFTATGTTPTKWTNSSTVVEIGGTLILEPEGIQPNPGQWLDSSTNKLHALQPATGTSLIRKKDTFEVRWTTSWTASHEAQYIGGVNQNVLPVDCLVRTITAIVSGVDIEDIIVGDGSADTDHWIALVDGLWVDEGSYVFTVENISDGTNRKLVADPDADCTMSIDWTVQGIIVQ